MQVLCMVRRITNMKCGLKDDDILRLIQALILSRLEYSIPYISLTAVDLHTLDILLRTSYEQALRLPTGTSTWRLEGLGVHNTVEELVEAQLVDQKQTLPRSTMRRYILQQQGYPLHTIQSPPKIALHFRSQMHYPSIPRNVHATHHARRRQARAQALIRKYGIHSNTLCVNAATISPTLGGRYERARW
ncbi:hypothetical protein HPB49_007365 [Dermacentor silvarum]|uniref:Uncharacterized protein n=1 Tax=Dermacentor silvarum TaxID=543639 RepID=A0ACB8D3U6_DERSI|nr:hypothetical protein HPB49_007365 [Dermacentor silvarum]